MASSNGMLLVAVQLVSKAACCVAHIAVHALDLCLPLALIIVLLLSVLVGC